MRRLTGKVRSQTFCWSSLGSSAKEWKPVGGIVGTVVRVEEEDVAVIVNRLERYALEGKAKSHFVAYLGLLYTVVS